MSGPNRGISGSNKIPYYLAEVTEETEAALDDPTSEVCDLTLYQTIEEGLCITR